jgi:hypothetical protein
MLQPAVIGGLVIGVLSALPLISAGNLCCCLWVITGGAVAAYVLQQNQAAPITPGDGALVGLLAGLVGAGVHLVLSIPITLMMAPMERAMMQRIVDVAGSMQPEMRETLDKFAGQRVAVGAAGFILGRIVGFIFMLFVGAIFSTVGGLLGAVFFRKSAPPDAPPAS